MVQQVRDLTNGGVHHSFEVLGRKETAEQAFAMLAPGGTATIVGMIPFGQKIELHGFDFLRERKIQGSSMGSNHFRVDMPRLVEFYMRGKLHLEDWISARLKLSEINEGFADDEGRQDRAQRDHVRCVRSLIVRRCACWREPANPSIYDQEHGLPRARAFRVKPRNDGLGATYRETCAETASQRPFCLAQQSV